MKKIILIVFVLFMGCGCYDYQELSDMSVVNGIGIDYKDDKYIVYLEVIKSAKADSANEIKTNVVSGEDEVLANAFSKAINTTDKKVYMRHVELLLLSERLIENDIEPVVDYIIRDVSISTNFFTVVADDPEEILKEDFDDDSSSNKVVDTLTYNVEARSLDNIDIIASNGINENIDVALPFVSLEDDNINTEDIVYFKLNDYVGKTNNKIYNFLVLDSNNIDFAKDDNVLNIYRKKISYKVEKDMIIIDVAGDGRVKEVSEDFNLENVKDYNDIEKLINEQIRKEIEDFLHETISNESDLLGLKDKYYKKYKKQMKDISYQVNVDITLNRNGTIYEVLHDK